MGKRIAIIGTGVGALAAARQLSAANHEVTLFEKDEHIGGHAYTVDVTINGEQVPLDLGVQIIVPSYYPNVMAMIGELNKTGADISLRASPMSLYAAGKDGVGWGNTAEYQRRPEVQAVWTKAVQQQASDFMLRASLMTPEESEETIESWTKKVDASPTFVDNVLAPVLSTVTLTSSGLIRVPFIFITGIFPGMLSFSNATTWFRFNGGIKTFIDALCEPFADRIHTATKVQHIEPMSSGAAITTEKFGTQAFDKVIYGGSLGLLSKLVPESYWQCHADVLGHFKNQNSYMVVHQDMDGIPDNVPLDAGEIFDARDVSPDQMATQHDNLNVLYGVKKTAKQSYAWNTLYPFKPKKKQLPSNLLLPPVPWKHEFLDQDSLQSREALHTVQGQGNLWFCGASTSVPGFEQCFISGLAVASQIDPSIKYPFADAPGAAASYDMISGIMFPG